MEVSYQTERFINLRLTEEEAAYLHGICQNPYPGDTNEHPKNAAIRCALFQATDPRSENGKPIGWLPVPAQPTQTLEPRGCTCPACT